MVFCIKMATLIGIWGWTFMLPIELVCWPRKKKHLTHDYLMWPSKETAWSLIVIFLPRTMLRMVSVILICFFISGWIGICKLWKVTRFWCTCKQRDKLLWKNCHYQIWQNIPRRQGTYIFWTKLSWDEPPHMLSCNAPPPPPPQKKKKKKPPPIPHIHPPHLSLTLCRHIFDITSLVTVFFAMATQGTLRWNVGISAIIALFSLCISYVAANALNRRISVMYWHWTSGL